MRSHDIDKQFIFHSGVLKYFGLMMVCVARNVALLLKLMKYKVIVLMKYMFYFILILSLLFSLMKLPVTSATVPKSFFMPNRGFPIISQVAHAYQL